MQIFSKISPLNALANTASVSFSQGLINYVAINAGIPALGLWVLLCSQQNSDQQSKQQFCQQHNITTAAFDKTMAKLTALNLVWQEADAGFELDWFVANVPKNIAELTDRFMVEVEALFSADSLATGAGQQGQQHSDSFSPLDDALYQQTSAPVNFDWQALPLKQDFFDLAAQKIPAELVTKYWDTFIASNDNKGEAIPERSLLYKKWKSYVANVSVNLAVSERRTSQHYQRRIEQNTAEQERNIAAWQALLETKIPNAQSFSAAMHNLASVEDDVWHGFIQQNIRLKREPLNLTNLQYAFEEYCQTTGQKFLQQKAPPKEIDHQLNDTSWADNMDDTL